jgi:hypothetical protein
MLMSSDNTHTQLAGFVANKNVIKPYSAVLLFPPLSPPFSSSALAATSRFTGPAVGRKQDGEEPEQNVLILSFNPTDESVFV